MIGDKDLATNLFRSQQLNNGKSLTEVTEEIKNKFNIKCNIFPMSDSIVSTKLLTKTGKKLDFQEYFVEKKGRPRLKKIIYEGSKIAKVSNTLFKEIKNSDIVIIGPSNPFLSIGPILSLKQIKKVLAEHQNVIVISPFINNKALKGPSKNNFLDMGLTPDIHGLKKFYKNIGNKFIVHFEDSDNSSNTYEENIIFNSNKDSEKLASKIMAL